MSYRGPTDHEIKQSAQSWITEYLDRADKSQADLARALGVTEATISNIVLGKFLPGFTVLVRLHFALGVELREVMRHERREAHPTKGCAPEMKPVARFLASCADHAGRGMVPSLGTQIVQVALL